MKIKRFFVVVKSQLLCIYYLFYCLFLGYHMSWKRYQSHIFQWLVIFLWLAGLSLRLSSYINESTIAAWMDGNIRAPWIYVLLKAATVVFAPLSWTTLYVIAPVLRWPMEAILYTVIGNAIGISVAYWLGMHYADRIVLRLFGKKWLVQAHGIVDTISSYWKFLVVRIVLFPLEDLINYTAGMAKVPFWWFFIVSICITTGLFVWFVLWFDWVQSIL